MHPLPTYPCATTCNGMAELEQESKESGRALLAMRERQHPGHAQGIRSIARCTLWRGALGSSWFRKGTVRECAWEQGPPTDSVDDGAPNCGPGPGKGWRITESCGRPSSRPSARTSSLKSSLGWSTRGGVDSCSGHARGSNCSGRTHAGCFWTSLYRMSLMGLSMAGADVRGPSAIRRIASGV